MAYYTDRPYQRAAGGKTGGQTFFFAFCVFVHVLEMICIIIDSNKKFPNNNKLRHISRNKFNVTIFKSLT